MRLAEETAHAWPAIRPLGRMASTAGVENPLEGMIAEMKYFVQLATNHDGVQTDPDQTAGQAVMHLIGFFNPASHHLQAMLVVLEAGGIAPGGLNFDAKVRREWYSPDEELSEEDLVTATAVLQAELPPE